MIRKEEFYAVNLEEAMKKAVSFFGISEEKIFLNVLDKKENEVHVEALIDLNLVLEGKRYLESILKQFNVEYKIEYKVNLDESEISYDITTSENAVLIGYKGRTLDAIQNLVRDLLKNYAQKHLIITIDIGGFREKRKNQLEIIATKIAKEVCDTKIDVKLDPMNSFERRIIHTKLAQWRDVTTESDGLGEERAIVIKYKNRKSTM